MNMETTPYPVHINDLAMKKFVVNHMGCNKIAMRNLPSGTVCCDVASMYKNFPF